MQIESSNVSKNPKKSRHFRASMSNKENQVLSLTEVSKKRKPQFESSFSKQCKKMKISVENGSKILSKLT
jgi:hypothetical protein